MIIYKYNDYIVAEDSKSNLVIMQKDFNFYKLPLDKKDSYLNEKNLVSKKEIKDNFISFILITGIIIFTVIIFLLSGNYTLVDKNIFIATVFLLVNIPIHELGHIIFLKMYYKESKIKVGFKFIFIYPAFFVNTSYSYFLPKYKRMSVYLAGSLMNCLFVLFIYFLFPSYTKYCYIIVTNIIINFIPIVRSDGYYALMAMIKKYNFCKKRKKEYIEDFIRGFIMFLFMSFFSYIF